MQAVATMGTALAISVPLGVILGRLAWRAFADRLGVLTDPSTSPLVLLAASLGGLVIAWVVSLPGQAVATGRQLPLRRE